MSKTPRDSKGKEIWIPPTVKDPGKKQEYVDAHNQRDRVKDWTNSQPDRAMDDIGSVGNHQQSAACNVDKSHEGGSDRDRQSYKHYAEQNLDKAQEKLGQMRDTVQETRNKRLKGGGESRL